ncbi:MAG: 4Fe-4S binding protein, partial [Pseudomonadota bacterium]
MSNAKLLVCNCQKTMSIDGARLAEALGRDEPLAVATELCRSECSIFESGLATGQPIQVACTQEAPLFAEIAEEADAVERVSFVNIRERAGWCDTPEAAVPKMAALLAESTYPSAPAGLTTLKSDGVCLVIACDQVGVDAAASLATELSVTLVLTQHDDVILPRQSIFAVHAGRIRAASGRLGAFDVVADGFADLVPSSRGALSFTMPRDGAKSRCDLIVDLSGNATPLFPPQARRDGYFRADPASPVAVDRLVGEARDYIGEFEKPIYVVTEPEICAHSRSAKVGCSKCLNVCPTGAITPDGDHVAIDAAICGGCGSCSAVCPTGAVEYAYPRRNDLVARMQIMIGAYAGSGGTKPRLLLHDLSHGEDLIAALARFGNGLPHNVLPIGLHAVFQAGHTTLLAALASGFQDVVCLISPEHAHERPVLDAECDLTHAILDGLGLGGPRVRVCETTDPDVLDEVLRADLGEIPELPRQTFATSGKKRELGRLAITKLRDHALTREPENTASFETLKLPEGAPYGQINVNTDGCTLCLACVSACPADAISD